MDDREGRDGNDAADTTADTTAVEPAVVDLAAEPTIDPAADAEAQRRETIILPPPSTSTITSTMPSTAKAGLTSILIIVAFAAHTLLYDLLDRRHRDGAKGFFDFDKAAIAAATTTTTTTGGKVVPVWKEPEEAEFNPWRLLPSVFISQGQEISSYEFSVLLISYHKTGHDLGMDLVDYIKYEFPGANAPHITEYGNKSPLKHRRHPAITPCARIHLETGGIMVQHAPDLFCTPGELAQTLLFGGDRHFAGDRGVKVVHLVRNPFEMAVSNYHYHTQVPPPEPWVTKQNPCDIEYAEDLITDTYPDMIIPTLSKMKYASLNNLEFGGQPLLTREEFDMITHDCLSLYQTKKKLRSATLLDHLMNYDAPEGLRLATAEMMVQGYHNGGDILRMANNMVKLKQAQMKVASHEEKFEWKQLQVYTMSLDDFIQRPAEMAYRFFDFVVDDDGTHELRTKKEEVAHRYEQYYEKKMMKGSRHITHGKNRNSEELKEYLRHDPVFGPPMGKVQSLVETCLAESRGDG